MNVSKISEVKPVTVKPGCKRRILHTDHLMMVAIDFTGGPAANPDPAHNHFHEQVTYVAEGGSLRGTWYPFPPTCPTGFNC
jgi:hypothetical protein